MKPINSGQGCHCFSAFSDQDVFICTDQKLCGGDINIVRETLLTGLFHAPRLGGSQCTAWGGVTGKSKYRTLMKHSNRLTSRLRGLMKGKRKKTTLQSLASRSYLSSEFTAAFLPTLNVSGISSTICIQ